MSQIKHIPRHEIEKQLENKNAQLAQLQELCSRTLSILIDENFFETSLDKDGYGHVSLERDLKKASKGKEFKLFLELMKNVPSKLEAELDELKNRTCESCKYFTTPKFKFSVCEKIGNVTVPHDFYCNKWELKK